MSEVTIIGIDLAKRVFQLHGARDDGTVEFRKKLSRSPKSVRTFTATIGTEKVAACGAA